MHKESGDSIHNDRLLSIDNMGSILQLYLNRTKRSGSCLNEPVPNNDDDQNPTNNKPNSVNQLMLKENCQQSDNQLLGMLCRLNEIDEQLEKFQIQRRIDNENTSQILSSLRSTEEENKILNESIRPGEYALSKYQETREVKKRLNEIETRLAQIQKINFEETNSLHLG
ncbi:MORN repeat containing 2, variant 2 [Schistosoma haematobium]|uniref:MORN repeat containing 2, variant 2 n=1 Tax=Schistosoma haematobium TaxID=6185 RepID=A0A922S556_SCHHA|nr:MORN repeat containing 2, variant 2 [Schistosoma haematobium]KAH9594214.1 MORN repeat containing 2, variant 2 [Schistosoma haematobium]